MPRAAVPNLRRHKRGHFFWREGGRDVYAGRDLAQAESAWRLRWRPYAAPEPARSPRAASASPPLSPSTRSLRTVSDLAERLWSVIDAQCVPERRRVYRYELAPFLALYGGRRLDELSADDLLSYRASAAKRYKPWTVNGRLAVVRRLLTLADDLGWVDRPYRLRMLRGVPVGETKPKAWTLAEVSALVAKAAETNPNLARMMRLQFLCALRPFSVPEVVFGRGRWEATGVFVLDRSKCEKRTGEKQRVCFSDEALAELARITPEYGEGRLYRQAVKRACGKPPHALRHSAATALANAGVADELIECALGHSLGRVKRVYRPQKYEETRRALSVLGALVPAV